MPNAGATENGYQLVVLLPLPPGGFSEMVALKGRPSVADRSLQPGRVFKLLTLAFGLSFVSVVALLSLWLALSIALGTPLRSPP